MFKGFEEYINESNMSGQIVRYRWLDYFKNEWYETKCEVISHTDKTAVIKLLGFGKNGTPPGTRMRVHLKSLIGFDYGNRKKPDMSWRRHTDPDLFKDDDDNVNEGRKTPDERASEAGNLIGVAKKFLDDGDVENAAETWCEIHDLYADMWEMDNRNTGERVRLFSDFQRIMREFTDDEVFKITDYLKKRMIDDLKK